MTKDIDELTQRKANAAAQRSHSKGLAYARERIAGRQKDLRCEANQAGAASGSGQLADKLLNHDPAQAGRPLYLAWLCVNAQSGDYIGIVACDDNAIVGEGGLWVISRRRTRDRHMHCACKQTKALVQIAEQKESPS